MYKLALLNKQAKADPQATIIKALPAIGGAGIGLGAGWLLKKIFGAKNNILPIVGALAGGYGGYKRRRELFDLLQSIQDTNEDMPFDDRDVRMRFNQVIHGNPVYKFVDKTNKLIRDAESLYTHI